MNDTGRVRSANHGYERLDIKNSDYHVEYKPGFEHDFMIYHGEDRDPFLEINLVRDLLFMLLDK